MRVTFLRSGIAAEWDPQAGSLLEFAEQCGLAPPFCCRAGVCGTCQSVLRSGAVKYLEVPVAEPSAGEILLCCSCPTEDVAIEI